MASPKMSSDTVEKSYDNCYYTDGEMYALADVAEGVDRQHRKHHDGQDTG